MKTRAIPKAGSLRHETTTVKQSTRQPLSSNQLRIWFVEQLADRTAVNNLYFGLRLTGQLDLAALDQSLKILVDRHEALRTTFDLRNGEPVQFTDESRSPIRAMIDLSGRPDQDLEQDAYALARREVHMPFDLRKGPLVRLVVLRLDHQTHILLVILHQIVCDGWSLGLFANELAVCYAAFCGGAIPELKLLNLQYADYACWQREWLENKGHEQQLSYWSRKLAGANLLVDLSTHGVRPAEQSFEGASQARRLPDDLLKQLTAVATRYKTTSFVLFLTVFQVVLHQYTGETDILVGMPVAGRESVELEGVIGLFANLVVVRTDLSGNPPFSDLLRDVRNTVLEALANQYLPFERLVEALHPSRSLAQNPIFQVLFASVKAAAPWNSFGDLEASPYNIEASAAAFDLNMSCIEESSDTWWLRAEYQTDLFNYAQIEGLLDHYMHMLISVAARPEVRLSQLDRPSEWPAAKLRHGREAASSTGTILGNVGTLPWQAAKAEPTESRPHVQGQSSDPLEESLSDLWVKVLAVHPPAATSNFFELGGHSLMAVRLAAEIGRMYKTNFPVSLVFQAPTIEGMAQRVRAQVSSASTVVCVQDDGHLPPFFCGGSMRELLDLSRGLGSDQPFFQLDAFALQQNRLFANEPLVASVSDLAARFRRDIVSIQPAGPYFLGGMCEGGIIALEIALQLQAEGREVALLAEFDTAVNGYWRRRSIDWLRQGRLLLLSGRLPSKLSQRLFARKKRRLPMSEHEYRQLQIWNYTWRIIRDYRPNTKFEGEIQIFRAPRPSTWFYEDVVTGWEARASRGIRVHEVLGEHGKLFGHPVSQRIIANVIKLATSPSAKN
jgi:thioesterase domain-containing protein